MSLPDKANFGKKQCASVWRHISNEHYFLDCEYFCHFDRIFKLPLVFDVFSWLVHILFYQKFNPFI